MGKLWLTTDESEEIITRGIITVTNESEYAFFVERMKDIGMYIQLSEEIHSGPVKDEIIYSIDGATQYENAPQSGVHFMRKYLNPNAEVLNLITTEPKNNKNLLDLFSTIESRDNQRMQLERLKQAKEMIEKLKNSNLDMETIKQILVSLFPNFALYAISGLNFTNIQIEKSYDLAKVKKIYDLSIKAGLEISGEVQEVLNNVELAQTNGKILSLARSVNKFINK